MGTTTSAAPKARFVSRWGRIRRAVGSDAVNGVTLTFVERWPLAFTDPPRPLVIGIHNDIVPKMNREPIIISLALHDWTERSAYLSALAAGGMRYDLDGQPNGEVTQSEQAYAASILARRQRPNGRRRGG